MIPIKDDFANYFDASWLSSYECIDLCSPLNDALPEWNSENTATIQRRMNYCLKIIFKKIELPWPETMANTCWKTVSTLLGLISSIYHDLPHWRLNIYGIVGNE